MTNKLDESFISENSFEILSLGFGLVLFQELSSLGSAYIEEKIKEIRKLNFKTLVFELVIVHLILLIMRFAYPSLITILSKISDIFNYEIAQFILAEGIIFIAFGIFHLKYLFEPVYEIYYPEYSKGITDIDKFLYETRKH